MKKILLVILICLTAALTLGAQTQQGYVKTPGRLGTDGKVIPGNRLSGASIQVKGCNAVKSGKDGNFSFPIPANKFFLQSVKKQGYVLTDPDATKRQYTYSSNPLILVMDSQSQQLANKLANEKKIRRTLQRQLQDKEDQIEALKEQNKITLEEYQKKLQQLYAEQESNEKLISDMAERYSQIDFDQLDEFNQRISNCIINGRLTEANSLLRSKGDINTRIAELNQHHEANEQAQVTLDKSKAMEQKNRDDIAQDCYNFYQKFLMEHQNDSAAHYLELRVNHLDSTNLDWLIHAGYFIEYYLANYSLALNYYQRGLRHAQAQFGEDNEWVAAFYNNIGFVYNSLGNYDKALEYTCKALNINKMKSEVEDSDIAKSYNNIGGIYSKLGNEDAALEFYQKALSISERVLGAEHPDLATYYNNIGSFYRRQDEEDTALVFYQKALHISEVALGENHPNVAMCYNNIGVVYESFGDFDKALEYYLKALNINERVFGTNHPQAATSYHNIALIYLELNNNDKALEYNQKALTIREHIFGTYHHDVAICYNDIGVAYDNKGDKHTALENYKKAIEISERLGTGGPDVAMIYKNIYAVYLWQGEYDKALENLQKALNVHERKKYLSPFVYIEYCNFFYDIGITFFEQGVNNKAIECFQQITDIQERVFGKDHPLTKNTKSIIENLKDQMNKNENDKASF